MLNKMSVSELALLSNLSKAYISQVKHGQRPPSARLLKVLETLGPKNNRANGARRMTEVGTAIDGFLKSRREGVSQGTIEFYSKYLIKAIPVLGLRPKPAALDHYFASLSCSTGGKHAYFRAMSVFYNWLYSPRSESGMNPPDNPFTLVDPPKRPKLILPSLSREDVQLLIGKAASIRDKAIIALFTESGLRVSELLGIKAHDIDWEARTVRVIGKGNKEGYGPFGELAAHYLKLWLAEYSPHSGQPIWDIGYGGIRTMLDNLKRETGLPCNPHTFRRTFACLLRKAGVDSLTIKDLGRWESFEMVQRYTRSVTFEDSLRHYKAPLG